MTYPATVLKILEQCFKLIDTETASPVFLYDESGRVIFSSERSSSSKETRRPVVFNGKTICTLGIQAEPEQAQNIANLGSKLIAARLAEEELREKLQKAEKKYATIFNTYQDVYFETTLDGRFISISPTITEYSGYSVEELLNNPVEILYNNPDDRSMLLEQLKKHNRVRDFEMEYRRKDGSIYWASLNADFFTDNDGIVKGLKGTIRDITDRKKAEQQLKKSEEKFRMIFENAPLGIFHYDENGRITEINDSLIEILGSSREKLIGFNMLSTPEQRLTRAIKAALSGKMSFFEGEYRSVTGNKISPLRCLYGPVFSPEGKVDGCIGIVEDITEYKKTKAELKKSKKRFRELAELLPEAIFEINTQGKVIFVNQKGLELFSLTREDIKKGLNLFEQFHPKDRKKALENFHRILNNENIDITEYEAKNKKGHYFPILFNCSLIYQEGTIMGLLGFVIDISEKKHTQEILIQSEKMMSIGGLAAGMAHEINNPLGGMIQNAQLAKNRLTNDMPVNIKAAERAGTTIETIKNYVDQRGIVRQLDHIVTAGQHAAAIVQNMLAFARKTEPIKIFEDLTVVIEKTLDLISNDYVLKKKFDFKKFQIIKEYDNSIPKVRCEVTKIQQVLINIIKNSIDAMTESGKEINDFLLKIKLQKERQMVLIKISDNGPGMEPDVRNRIFEPFFSTKQIKKGTGLGLSISYFIIVDDHKGEMDVISEPGKGTTFIIRLPL